jgi:hypothetical protein
MGARVEGEEMTNFDERYRPQINLFSGELEAPHVAQDEEEQRESAVAPQLPPPPAVPAQADHVSAPSTDDAQQEVLFDVPPPWKEHWVGMPEFKQRDLMPWDTILVHFRNREDRNAFAKLVDQRIGDPSGRQARFIWYPKAEIGQFAGKAWVDSTTPQNVQDLAPAAPGPAPRRQTSRDGLPLESELPPTPDAEPLDDVALL